MGLSDFFMKKKDKPMLEDTKSALTYADKERILVERMTEEDVQQFTAMPYNLNCPLHKYDNPESHAFAYMNLTGQNVDVAKTEMQKLNVVIDYAQKNIPLIPKWARINIDKIAFYDYSPNYGYTRLMCSPYTYTGKIARFPLVLFFISFQPKDSIGISVNGEIKYSENGKIASATVNCWYRRSWKKAADGWQYIFYDNNGDLIMREILSTIKADEYGRPTAIYRCPELLEEERQREQDIHNFRWIQENLPSIAPKSVSGFRRMRTTNSNNYQRIVTEAEKLGKHL